HGARLCRAFWTGGGAVQPGMGLCTGRTRGYLRAWANPKARPRPKPRPRICRDQGAIAMSMQSVASPAFSFTPPKRNSLTHIPGDEGWPVIGKPLQVLADPKGFIERNAARYGHVYRTHMFGETSISLLGPEANELVLFDQAKLFSSTHGWDPILGRLFPRGLMLLDFDEHRLHRRALSVAFKAGPMKSYLTELDKGIARRIVEWRQKPGPMLFYPAMKQL